MRRCVLFVPWALLACGVGLGLGCDDEADGDGDTDVDADVDGDIDADVDGDVDADADGDVDGDIDGDIDADIDADADADPVVVDSTHTGWQEPSCLGTGCHEYDDHNPDLDPYQCAACHGRNGAPSGHTSASVCGSCHTPPPHGADGFPDPAACMACHPN